ncbi:hypothetical protein PZA11_006790 [Diplocarpon coronariae]
MTARVATCRCSLSFSSCNVLSFNASSSALARRVFNSRDWSSRSLWRRLNSTALNSVTKTMCPPCMKVPPLASIFATTLSILAGRRSSLCAAFTTVFQMRCSDALNLAGLGLTHVSPWSEMFCRSCLRRLFLRSLNLLGRDSLIIAPSFLFIGVPSLFVLTGAGRSSSSFSFSDSSRSQSRGTFLLGVALFLNGKGVGVGVGEAAGSLSSSVNKRGVGDGEAAGSSSSSLSDSLFVSLVAGGEEVFLAGLVGVVGWSSISRWARAACTGSSSVRKAMASSTPIIESSCALRESVGAMAGVVVSSLEGRGLFVGSLMVMVGQVVQFDDVMCGGRAVGQKRELINL